MTAPKTSGRTAPRANSAPNSGSRSALQKHVDFFDTDHDGRISLSDTYNGLRRLGLDVPRSATFAALINIALGPKTSGALSLTIETEAIHAARHGSDTGVYDKRGHFSTSRFRRLFAALDVAGDGALDASALKQLLAENRTDLVGHLASKAEFSLLLEIAGETRNGQRVLTRERLERFYNGSLLYEIAQQVEKAS